MTEEQEKMIYGLSAMQSKQTIGGEIGGCGREQLQPSLCERIHSQCHDAKRESRRADQLMELEHLLEKHPEIARILDLLEAVRG